MGTLLLHSRGITAGRTRYYRIRMGCPVSVWMAAIMSGLFRPNNGSVRWVLPQYGEWKMVEQAETRNKKKTRKRPSEPKSSAGLFLF